MPWTCSALPFQPIRSFTILLFFFCAEVSGTGLRLAERVLLWVEDLKGGAVKAEDHVSLKGVYFVTAVINATLSTLLCHLCCYQNTLGWSLEQHLQVSF